MKTTEHLSGSPPSIQGKKLILLFITFFALMNASQAQRWMENLGRGTVAIRKSSNEVFVSWRILGPEFNTDIRFNVYRGNTRVASNLRVSNFTDNTNTNSTYCVAAVLNGVEQTKSPVVNVNTHVQGTNTLACVRVPINNTPNTYIGLIHVGDLNGDGEYDFVFTRHPNDPSQQILVEAYLNNGTFLWQYNCGPNSVNKNNIEPGSATLDAGHGDNWMVYDLNNDGKAEVIIRSSNGSVFGDKSVLRESNNNRQFISVLDGLTGKELTRASVPTDFIADGPMNGQMGIGYLDGTNPSVVWSSKNRVGNGGFNMMVTSYTLANGALGMNWKWIRRGGCPDGHNLRIIDVDGDGKDEIIPFGFALKPNGTLLWDLGTQGIIHGDRFHISDLDPNRPGLEGYLFQQDTPSKLGWAYSDAQSGQVLERQFMDGVYDLARGMAGDLDPRYSGYEFHTFTDGLYNVSGTRTSTSTPGSYPNLRIWWDGDLLSENLDNNKMTKWNYTGQYEDRLYTFRNNRQWSRNVPGCYGDILGDWREEAVYAADDGRSLLVFTTVAPTSERIYTLPHNPGYRNSMTNRGYYQSHMVDFYLGDGMKTPPAPNIIIVGKSTCTPTAVVPYYQLNEGTWTQGTTASTDVGGKVVLGPQPASGGTWSWTGPGGFTSATREITLDNIQQSQAGNYVATFKNTEGCASTGTITIKVCSPITVTHHVQIDGGAWIQTSSTSVNAGSTVRFGPHPMTAGTWSWSGPNGFTSTTREVTINSIQENQAGNYVAAYTDASGCQSKGTLVVTVNTITNTISPFEAPSSATVLPNPAETSFTVTVEEDVHSIEVIDMKGSILFAHGKVRKGESIDCGSDLASGLYTLMIRYTDGRVDAKRVQKL